MSGIFDCEAERDVRWFGGKIDKLSKTKGLKKSLKLHTKLFNIGRDDV